jgi:hypothetical protein
MSTCTYREMNAPSSGPAMITVGIAIVMPNSQTQVRLQGGDCREAAMATIAVMIN